MKLPDKLSAIHNVFHVSQLKKCLKVPEQVVNIEGIQLESDMTYSEYPVRVLDRKDRVTRRKTTKFYKVQWNLHLEDEATWESEDFLLEHFPEFLASV